MTGGDFALIRSVEFFEDFAEGGRRQAAALNVGDGDTFVAITEGGETSSVLGTLKYAAEHGARCFLNIRLVVELGRVDYKTAAETVFAAEEWIAAQDWTHVLKHICVKSENLSVYSTFSAFLMGYGLRCRNAPMNRSIATARKLHFLFA